MMTKTFMQDKVQAIKKMVIMFACLKESENEMFDELLVLAETADMKQLELDRRDAAIAEKDAEIKLLKNRVVLTKASWEKECKAETARAEKAETALEQALKDVERLKKEKGKSNEIRYAVFEENEKLELDLKDAEESKKIAWGDHASALRTAKEANNRAEKAEAELAKSEKAFNQLSEELEPTQSMVVTLEDELAGERKHYVSMLRFIVSNLHWDSPEQKKVKSEIERLEREDQKQGDE